MYTINSILDILSPTKVSIFDSSVEIRALEYDSRKIRFGEHSLFFALQSTRDGHTYIRDAYQKGVRNFIIADPKYNIDGLEQANFIWVKDTLDALQDLAAYHRRKFNIPVIGITGSNGKTIVKEWLFQLLSSNMICYQSPKSYNSQLGVALSLWDIHEEHEIALIEAGISQRGEMDKLSKMISPTIGVFTTLGTAHANGFDSKEEKLFEKWKLFSSTDTVVIQKEVLQTGINDSKCFLWGKDDDCDLKVVTINKLVGHSQLQLVYRSREHLLEVPFVDNASIDNVLTCISTMLVLDYSMAQIQQRIQILTPLEMRLQLKKGKNNCSIIDDSYSNDMASFQIALDFLQQQNQHPSKSLILTDFIGVTWNEKLRSKLIRLINGIGFEKIVLVGTHIIDIAKELRGAVSIFPDTPSLLHALSELSFENVTILIKGARKFELEAVINRLVQKSHNTVLEINLKAIEHNLSEYRSCIRPGVKLMAMVKAFSYGSGSFEIANVLQFNKVDYLSVAYVDEGVDLRIGGIQLPIMVMSPHEGTFDDLVRYHLEPEIYSLSILSAFIGFLERLDIKNYPIHIKLDTGMHRLGFMPEQIDDMLVVLGKTNRVHIKSLFSHLAGAGNSLFDTFTDQQVALFRATAECIESSIGYSCLKHICNSNGIVHRRDDQMDMVRLGIGLYGIDMAPKGLQLQNVSTLKTTITQIKQLKAEETVGYDRKGVLLRDSKIATVKIGYADGYNRRFGNGVGKMSIRGQLVPTVGNICMDMCMLDVTDIDVYEGEEVTVFPDVMGAAEDIGTIPYELLTGISSRVKRIYYYE